MSASAATFGLQPIRPLQSCMLDHLVDMPILNLMFGRSGDAAPVPKPMIKRRASPLKESPARDEEDDTSDCPMEQVADENPSASQQPENVNMEQVEYDRDSDDDDSDEEGHPLAGRPLSKAMPHPKLVPKSPTPTLRLVSKVKPAPKNTLDDETESDNHPGDRPALPRPTSDAACSHIQRSVVCNIWIGYEHQPPEGIRAPRTFRKLKIPEFCAQVLQGMLNHPQ